MFLNYFSEERVCLEVLYITRTRDTITIPHHHVTAISWCWKVHCVIFVFPVSCVVCSDFRLFLCLLMCCYFPISCNIFWTFLHVFVYVIIPLTADPQILMLVCDVTDYWDRIGHTLASMVRIHIDLSFDHWSSFSPTR